MDSDSLKLRRLLDELAWLRTQTTSVEKRIQELMMRKDG